MLLFILKLYVINDRPSTAYISMTVVVGALPPTCSLWGQAPPLPPLPPVSYTYDSVLKCAADAVHTTCTLYLVIKPQCMSEVTVVILCV